MKRAYLIKGLTLTLFFSLITLFLLYNTGRLNLLAAAGASAGDTLPPKKKQATLPSSKSGVMRYNELAEPATDTAKDNATYRHILYRAWPAVNSPRPWPDTSRHPDSLKLYEQERMLNYNMAASSSKTIIIMNEKSTAILKRILDSLWTIKTDNLRKSLNPKK